MKIIFVTREGYRLPGARIRCYNFARELNKYAIDAQVLSFSDTLGAKDGEEESKMSLGEKIKFNFSAIKRLSKDKEAVFCIQRFNYHAFAPYLVHLFNKNRIILDLDDWEMREDPKYHFGVFPSSKAHYLTRQIAKRSIFCISASRFLEEFLLQFNKQVCYLPSGVDTRLFNPFLNNLNENKIVFAWIGTLHKIEYVKNIEFALDCFSVLRREYSNIYFEIAGNGIYYGALVNIIKKFVDKNIVFKGWLEPKMIPEYLGTIHVGLMPVVDNVKFNIAKSPTKLFEYMAMAKPVVASDIGEARFIIKDNESGFLAKTKSDFIEKMRALIRDPKLRERLGQKARQCVEVQYSLDVLAERLYKMVKNYN